MPRAYSSDLRERVKRAVAKGGSCRQVAARYEVSVSFVVKLMQRWRERGTLTPAPMGGREPRRLAGHAERVRALVAAYPDLTIDGLRRHLADEGVTVSRSAVGRTLLAKGNRGKPQGDLPAAASEPVRDADGRVVGGEVFVVAGDEKGAGGLGRRPDDRVGQLDPTVAPDGHRPGGDLAVEVEDGEGVEKDARGGFAVRRRADQHLGPGDDADRPRVEAAELVPRLRHPAQVIDQHLGVEDRLHPGHSSRTRCW